MKFYFSFILIIITFLNCKNDDSKNAIDYAYIGGEIINPGTNYVVLSKDDVVIDTISLDKRNRFLYKIDDLHKGMYVFSHVDEIQMVLLEPKDSILFRLNTLEFDESLVFTGKGDKKNNYLINNFLENEKEEKYIIKLCQLPANIYQKHLDSLKEIKIKTFEAFKRKYNTSPLFQKIAQLNIDYSYYSRKEVYPFFHYGKNKKDLINSLPDDFYDYRKHINYNDAFLNNYFNYKTFLRHNISNLSLKKHIAHSTNGEVFNRRSLCYNLDKLKLIDSLIANPYIKDNLLFHFSTKYISKCKNEKHNNSILKSFLSKSKKEEDKKRLTTFTKAINNLKQGGKLPNIKIVSYNNNEFDINSLIKMPTVISYWSNIYYNHFKESHHKINELKIKYPEVKFISINIDDCGIIKSKKMLSSHKFDLKNEYAFKIPSNGSDTLAIYPITKTMIIDSNKKIVNSNTNLFSVNFEEQLLGLINK